MNMFYNIKLENKKIFIFFKLGFFCLELGKTYYLALGMELNFGPKIGRSRALH